MKLYKGYPVPSDRMGLLWALSTVKDLVIVEFGPEGTTRCLLESLKHYGCEAEAKIFTTMMDEEVVILGETGRLLKTLLEVDEKYSPEFMIVLDSSVASVIGIDTEGLCREYQPQIKAKLLSVTGGGLSGIWTEGLAAAMKLLAEMAVDGERRKGVFNILGCCADEFNSKAEAEIVKKLLEGLFRAETKCIFPLQAALADCQAMGNASLNIVLRREALPAARVLEERFGIPFVYGRPYGLQGTLRWVKQVEEVTGHQADRESLVGSLSELEERIAGVKAAGNSQSLKRAVIGGHPDTVSGLRTFLVDELGMFVQGYSIVPGNQDGDIPYLTDQESKRLTSSETVLVMADGINLRGVKHQGKVWTAHPAVDGISAGQPALMGLSGAVYLCKKMMKSLEITM